MKIAILGGAFDPPHIGHYLVARQVKELLEMDEVWFMVCYSYFPEFPGKMKRITGYEDRYAMATLLNENGNMRVSDFEYRFNKKSRTIDTLSLLKNRYSQHEFFWIIGSDVLPTFHLWNNLLTAIVTSTGYSRTVDKILDALRAHPFADTPGCFRYLATPGWF